jgi:D-tagatose-1,6-bisphosphate aldolase subunit GatZ/KbaZ
MSAIQEFLGLMKGNREGKGTGIYSICSAHPYVIKASMQQAARDNSIVLIESTSNQVDQFGGYTGMNPEQFAAYVKDIAKGENFPFEKVLLGGDHLGPNAWQNEPAASAMEKARTLVYDYVKAGYGKIHLDASMFCADDEGDRHKPLADEIVSSRAAELCSVAETSWKENRQGPCELVYIIGTEVPIPGGAQEEEETVTPTGPADASRTIEITKAAFETAGLQSAWKRVVGVVVQPGVEFGDDQVFHYNREAAAGLSKMIEGTDHLVYEAHSTDYQSESGLKNLVQDHYCILKVGPWVTFAFREALFALEEIEKELLGHGDKVLSALRDTLEEVMMDEPKYWKKYYPGNEATRYFKRKYSFSDRSRYYWPNKKLIASITLLKSNLDEAGIPLSILSQYMPNQYNAVQEGLIHLNCDELICSRIGDVIGIYARACNF